MLVIRCTKRYREYRRGNQELTIQRHRQPWAQNTEWGKRIDNAETRETLGTKHRMRKKNWRLSVSQHCQFLSSFCVLCLKLSVSQHCRFFLLFCVLCLRLPVSQIDNAETRATLGTKHRMRKKNWQCWDTGNLRHKTQNEEKKLTMLRHGQPCPYLSIVNSFSSFCVLCLRLSVSQHCQFFFLILCFVSKVARVSALSIFFPHSGDTDNLRHKTQNEEKELTMLRHGQP
jgi:hypothetical protein